MMIMIALLGVMCAALSFWVFDVCDRIRLLRDEIHFAMKKERDRISKLESKNVPVVGVCSVCGKVDFVGNMERSEEAYIKKVLHGMPGIFYCFDDKDSAMYKDIPIESIPKLRTVYKHKNCRKRKESK